MTCSCGVIRDLLPGYLAGTCEPESVSAVNEHLANCESCSQRFLNLQKEDAAFQHEMAQFEKWGVLWMLKDFLCRYWRTVLRYAAALAAACMILAAGYRVWFGLTQIDCVPVSSEDYQAAEITALPDGEIFCSYYARYHSTFTHHYIISDNTVYFPAMRPVLDRTYSMLDEYGGCWIMDPNSVWDERSQTYRSVKAIFLGNPDDCILVWQRGIDLPVASPEEQARIASIDWTIF